MKLKALLSLFALVAAVTSVCFVLFPAFSLGRFGAAADTQAIVPLQLAGALFGGLAVMAWMARNAKRSASRDAIVAGLVTLNIVATAVTVGGASSGAFNRFAWVPAVTFALFATTLLWTARVERSTVTD